MAEGMVPANAQALGLDPKSTLWTGLGRGDNVAASWVGSDPTAQSTQLVQKLPHMTTTSRFSFYCLLVVRNVVLIS